MSQYQIQIYLDGTFRRPSRTHSQIKITTIPAPLSDMVQYIVQTLLSKEAPIAPKIVISAGNQDMTPAHLPTLDPKMLRPNTKLFIDTMTDRITKPLTYLYHKVTERGGNLWIVSLYPRPANFCINSQVSNILSTAYLNANSYISFLNHRQKLPSIPIHQSLQFTSPHPALTTCQRAIDLKRYHRDRVTLTSTAQERLWRKLACALRRNWGPHRTQPPFPHRSHSTRQRHTTPKRSRSPLSTRRPIQRIRSMQTPRRGKQILTTPRPRSQSST